MCREAACTESGGSDRFVSGVQSRMPFFVPLFPDFFHLIYSCSYPALGGIFG